MRKETIAEIEIISLLIFIIHNMETSLFLHKLKDKYQHSEHFILIPDWHGVFPSKVCRLDSWSDYLMDFRTHTGNTSFASMCHNKKEQEEFDKLTKCYDNMKQTSLPEVIYLDIDSLITENNNAALVASIEEPINIIGVI